MFEGGVLGEGVTGRGCGDGNEGLVGKVTMEMEEFWAWITGRKSRKTKVTMRREYQTLFDEGTLARRGSINARHIERADDVKEGM